MAVSSYQAEILSLSKESAKLSWQGAKTCCESVSPEAQRIGEVLLLALILEASCTPAPGLVDMTSSGAHDDMDYLTLVRSAIAIGPSFAAMAEVGMGHTGPVHGLLDKVRSIGVQAEARMYEATGGVNTHKGAIFSLGLIAASTGYIIAGGGVPDRFQTTRTVQAITCGIVERDLLGLRRVKADPRHLSNGERIYMMHGLTGARGEAEAGFPTVFHHGLPALEKTLKCGLSLNDAMVHSLISIMANLDDTCVVHRSSVETLEDVVKPRARLALSQGGMLTEDGRCSILLMDKEFTSLGISPGGSGDLLAVTLALYFLPYVAPSFLT
ncbi:MAG: triphosphoribosyl-dephospho-CoA synthase [Bacillota bacterium]